MELLDPVKNFAEVEVSTGYDDSATSIVLETGEGSKLPDPATYGEYNVTWWNFTDYPNPALDPNVEIVRVTAISTDTLTVERNQEGSGASTKNTASKTYKMCLTITKKTLDEIDAMALASNNSVLRQAIINGGGYDAECIVKQRDPDNNVTISGGDTWADRADYYGCDRWLLYGEDSINWAQRTNVQNGFMSFIKNNDATETKVAAMQIIEARNSYPFRGRYLSFSLDVKKYGGSAVAGTVFILAMKSGGTADTLSNAPISSWNADGTRVTFDTTNYEVLYEADITIDTTEATITGTTSSAMTSTSKNLIFGVVCKDDLGTGAYEGFGIKEVQLNAGTIVLPYQLPDYASEIVKCQRYCQVWKDQILMTAYCTATNSVMGTVHFPNRMRATPTLTATAGDWVIIYGGGSSVDVSSISIGATSSGKHGVQLVASVATTPFTVGEGCILRFDATSGREFILESEL